MLRPGRYTGAVVAVANLDESIHALERVAVGRSRLVRLLFLRGDVLGRPADHERAVAVAENLNAESGPDALLCRAGAAGRVHRFADAMALLDRAAQAGAAPDVVDREYAGALLALGRHDEAVDRQRRAVRLRPDMANLATLAVVLAHRGDGAAADDLVRAALDADAGTSPFPAGQLLFERAVAALRHGDIGAARVWLGELLVLLPQHVPGRTRFAEACTVNETRGMQPSQDDQDGAIAEEVSAVRAEYAEEEAEAAEREAAGSPGTDLSVGGMPS